MELSSATAEHPIADTDLGRNRINVNTRRQESREEDEFSVFGTDSNDRVDVRRQVMISAESQGSDEYHDMDESAKASVESVEDTACKSRACDAASKSQSDVDHFDDCSSQNHSEDDDGSSVLLEGTSSDSSQFNSKPNRSQEVSVEYPEDGKVFLGNNDLGEYLHEYEGDMHFSKENWDALENRIHSPGRDQADDADTDADLPDNGECIDLPGPENGSELEYFMGNKVQVRGTGRPDLDDAEDDCGPGAQELTSQVSDSPPLRGSHSARNCGPGPEDGLGLSEGVSHNSSQAASSILSGIREVLQGADFDWQSRTDKQGYGELGPLSSRISSNEDLETQGQVDEHTLVDRESTSCRVASDAVIIPIVQPETRKQTRISDALSLSVGDHDGERQHAPWSEKRDMKSPSHLSTRTSDGLEEANSQGPINSEDAILTEDSAKNPLSDPHIGRGEDVSLGPFGDKPRAKGSVIRLGSKQAEELLQMDPRKLGRAVFTQTQTQPNSSTTYEQERISNLGSSAAAVGTDEVSRYVEALEVKETYIDTVLDMEDILFGAEDGAGARTFQGGKSSISTAPRRPARDGSVSASTSKEPTWRGGTEHPSNLPSEVEWIEVIGAFQKRGGASLGDRVVGLKEHTVYRIRVNRGGNEWEICRRYRDFVVLHNQLLQLFSHRDKVKLPAPWDQVKAESRKFFGNTSPGVVEKRSDLIQFCLQSLLEAGPPLSTATPLLRFLFPSKEVSWSMEGGWQLTQKPKGEGYFGSDIPQQGFSQSPAGSPTSSNTSVVKSNEDQNDGFQASVFGKTIRLVVQTHKRKTLKQQLQAQHYTCAGCYKDLESATGLVPEIVQNWGWSGPRYCDYSGQLFCSTCHLNETAIIPARVLQQWDFVPRPVSQLVKAYLDSIYDKPMLCVSAVNPLLFARVPVLAHITELRRTLNKMLGCIRCPARSRFVAMLGPRCYLLENNDFFALRDLADLSRGAFAVLPGYMQAISLKLSRHITRDCSTCQELGETCGAGNSCDDPFDVIYPHQERNITRCRACHVPYHSKCFYKCQKRCFCIKDRQSARTPTGAGGFERHASVSRSSLLVEGNEPLAGTVVSAAASENLEKPKRSFLETLLGSREGNTSEAQVENSSSVTLNMSQLTSALDL